MLCLEDLPLISMHFMIVFLKFYSKSGNKTSEILQPILLPDSVAALEFLPPSASSTNSEVTATQQSMNSHQEQVLESELIKGSLVLQIKTGSLLLEECRTLWGKPVCDFSTRL